MYYMYYMYYIGFFVYYKSKCVLYVLYNSICNGLYVLNSYLILKDLVHLEDRQDDLLKEDEFVDLSRVD